VNDSYIFESLIIRFLRSSIAVFADMLSDVTMGSMAIEGLERIIEIGNPVSDEIAASLKDMKKTLLDGKKSQKNKLKKSSIASKLLSHASKLSHQQQAQLLSSASTSSAATSMLMNHHPPSSGIIQSHHGHSHGEESDAYDLMEAACEDLDETNMQRFQSFMNKLELMDKSLNDFMTNSAAAAAQLATSSNKSTSVSSNATAVPSIGSIYQYEITSRKASKFMKLISSTCAICKTFYLKNSKDISYCNECKGIVCKQCDCSKFHINYDDLFATEDEKKTTSKSQAKANNKKLSASATSTRMTTASLTTAMPPLEASTGSTATSQAKKKKQKQKAKKALLKANNQQQQENLLPTEDDATASDDDEVDDTAPTPTPPAAAVIVIEPAASSPRDRPEVITSSLQPTITVPPAAATVSSISTSPTGLSAKEIARHSMAVFKDSVNSKSTANATNNTTATAHGNGKDFKKANASGSNATKAPSLAAASMDDGDNGEWAQVSSAATNKRRQSSNLSATSAAAVPASSPTSATYASAATATATATTTKLLKVIPGLNTTSATVTANSSTSAAAAGKKTSKTVTTTAPPPKPPQDQTTAAAARSRSIPAAPVLITPPPPTASTAVNKSYLGVVRAADSKTTASSATAMAATAPAHEEEPSYLVTSSFADFPSLASNSKQPAAAANIIKGKAMHDYQSLKLTSSISSTSTAAVVTNDDDYDDVDDLLSSAVSVSLYDHHPPTSFFPSSNGQAMQGAYDQMNSLAYDPQAMHFDMSYDRSATMLPDFHYESLASSSGGNGSSLLASSSTFNSATTDSLTMLPNDEISILDMIHHLGFR
jgi:hypothetical protein